MKTLSSTLEAAQKSGSAAPAISAVLSDQQSFVTRFRFERVYSGSEAAGPAAVAVAADGALIRARIDPGTDTLYTQRVASPGPGSTFSSWTSQGLVSIGSTCALACTGSTVYLFFVHLDTLRVRMKVSSDNGATFGATTTVTTEASPVSRVAAAANSSGDVLLLWTVGANVRSARYTGSWSSPAGWGQTVDSITGIAVNWHADFQVCVTGTETTTTEAKIYTLLYGDGFALSADTWGSLLAIETAVSGSDIVFHSPALEFAGNAHRVFFLERFNGNVASRRLHQSWLDVTWDMSNDRWREPFPIDYVPTDDFGLSATYDSASDVFWLSTPAGVWYALLDGIETIDVSGDIVAVEVDIGENDGRVRLELRNEDGRYSGHPSVSRGMRLALAPGYVTENGAETAAASWYWVESIELTTGAGRPAHAQRLVAPRPLARATPVQLGSGHDDVHRGAGLCDGASRPGGELRRLEQRAADLAARLHDQPRRKRQDRGAADPGWPPGRNALRPGRR
jgi:hypothetical protein